jgi:hypothetical protein
MNVKLQAISAKAAEDLQDLIQASESKILEAWDAATSEAQDNETAPKFKLGFAITLSLDDDKMETALTYGIKHKMTVESTIPDPNQMPLPMDATEGTVTLKSGDKEVTVGTKAFSEGLRKLNEVAKKRGIA